jgi:tight adherence protein C
MTLVAYISIFIAVTLFTYQFFEAEGDRRVRMALNPGQGRRRSTLMLYRLTAPFVVQLAPVIRRLPIQGLLERTRTRLAAAGFQAQIEPEEFLAYRLVLACFAAVLPLVFQIYSWLAIVMIAAFAMYYPSFWLSATIKKRRTEILLDLPYFIDLVTLSVEAGLDFQIALQRVVQKSDPGALRDELHLMLQEIKMGKTRAEALRALALRVGVQDITSFAAVLIQADQLGASIGQVLRAQADKMRTERFQRAEKAGAQAATKVLLPIMLFILPALFLVVFGAFILSFFDMSRGMLGNF